MKSLLMNFGRLFLCWLAAACFVGAAPAVCATEAAPGEFEKLGPQLFARTFQAATFARDADGRDVVCAVVRSQPAAKLFVADATTGAVRHEFVLPEASGAWAATTASDGSVYIGTEPNAKLFRWVPGESDVRDLGRALNGETFIWALTAGADGEVFGGTYGGGRAFRYAPKDGFSEPAPGPIVPGQNYARSIAFDPVERRLFVGLGVQSPHLVEISLRTGERREWLTEPYPGEQSVYAMSLSGDYLFAMLSPSRRALVFEHRTRRLVGEVRIPSLYQSTSAPSPHDGTIYFVDGGQLKAFDPAKPAAPSRAVLPVASSQAMAWLRGGEGRAELVVFTQAGQLVRYDPVSGASRTVAVSVPEQPVVIQSLVAAADGRIWMGGYLSGGLAAFDPETRQAEQFRGVSQAERIESLGGKLYLGLYPGGRVAELDPTQPWNVGTNPQQTGVFKDQSRPVAMVGVPELGRLFVGFIPEYGLLGGDLAVWDVAKREWQTFSKVVPQQSIASLAYAHGLVIGGTTVHGGLGIQPTEREGRLFLWDPATNRKIFETVPVAGKGIVSGLLPRPDGTVWGFAQGAFFVFDPVARKVTEVRELFTVDFSDRAMWQDANLMMHPNGDVYGVEDGRFLRFDPRTREATVLREQPEKKHTRPIAIDRRGRIYLGDGANLWRYTP